MMRYIYLALVFCTFGFNITTAQSKKEKKKAEEEAAQLSNYRQGYKKMFIDSLSLTPAIADTAAAIEVASIQKKGEIFKDKKLEQDDKDFQMGMLDEQKDNKLKLILPREAYDKYAAMQKRWKADREAQEKAAKDAQNSQPMMGNRYGGGYGGYGRGYGGYGRY